MKLSGGAVRKSINNLMDLLDREMHLIDCDPNRSLRFLVRVVSPGTEVLDLLPPGKTKDTFAYGRTREEAAARALQQLEKLKIAYRKKLSPVVRRSWK